MKAAFHTLGCKVNQVETGQIKEDFQARGYKIVNFNEEADIYIINTCTVTHISDRKSRAMIRRAVRRNPSAVIVAIGCGPQVNPGQFAEIEGLNLLVGNSAKENIAQIVEDYRAGQDNSLKIINRSISINDNLKTLEYTHHHKRTRGFIKIQDGCENYCSYCIIPYARGPVRSKKPENVLYEIEQMLSIGYREMVLTGIHTGLYGKDIPGWNLSRLFKEIFQYVKGRYRLRLSSIEPLEVSEELIELIASESAVCRHLHIPLQSGSDNILSSMNRRYSRDYYRNLVYTLVSKIPDIAITADVMVGFPGESENDFIQSLELLEDIPIYNLHVFPYSAREGTKAAKFSQQVDENEKHRRSQSLIQLADQKKQEFIENLASRDLEVLVEQKIGPGLFRGLSDNYIKVEIYAEEDISGEFINVTLADDGKAVIKPGKVPKK